MASWDDEDFEPTEATTTSLNHFAGEDEDDDDIKDNWDDDEEEKKEEVKVEPVKQKKKKNIAEKIKEKEEKARQEKLARMEELKKMEEENKELTPEEEMEEKLRRQKLQEESDLELAKDAFGVSDIPGQKTIDNFVPLNKDEFLELSNMIVQKLSKFEARAEYQLFLETLVRDCCAGLEAEDIKKISNNLNILVNEKQKLNKVAKGKKKTGAANKKTLATGKGVKDDMDYDDSYYNEYEDFM